MRRRAIGPLIVWLIKKDDAPFAADQAKESLNFQISLLLYTIGIFTSIFLIVGLFLIWFVLPFLALIGFVLPIVAAVRANEGRAYRYPFTIRLIH